MDSVGNAQEENEEGKGPSENDSLVTTDRDGEVLQQEDEEEAKIGPSENDSLVIADRGGEVLGEVEKNKKSSQREAGPSRRCTPKWRCCAVLPLLIWCTLVAVDRIDRAMCICEHPACPVLCGKWPHAAAQIVCAAVPAGPAQTSEVRSSPGLVVVDTLELAQPVYDSKGNVSHLINLDDTITGKYTLHGIRSGSRDVPQTTDSRSSSTKAHSQGEKVCFSQYRRNTTERSKKCISRSAIDRPAICYIPENGFGIGSFQHLTQYLYPCWSFFWRRRKRLRALLAPKTVFEKLSA